MLNQSRLHIPPVMSFTPVRFTNTAANSQSSVLLVGSWSEWKMHEVMSLENGIFVLQTKLPPGLYEYKFIVDGVWSLDPNEPAFAPSGHHNHQIVVPYPIRLRVKLNHGSSLPYSLTVNTLWSIDDNIRRAKKIFNLDDQTDYDLISQGRSGIEALITSWSQVRGNDLLYLLPSSKLRDTLEECLDLSEQSSDDIVQLPTQEQLQKSKFPVHLVRTDSNEVIFSGASLEDAHDFAIEQCRAVTVPLKIVSDIPLRIGKCIVRA